MLCFHNVFDTACVYDSSQMRVYVRASVEDPSDDHTEASRVRQCTRVSISRVKEISALNRESVKTRVRCTHLPSGWHDVMRHSKRRGDG